MDSIYAQNLPQGSYEVWVIDGGSTDETVDILKNHPLRPNFLSEPDHGQAHAINKGISKSKGDFIAWINSDDYYHDGAFTVLRQYITGNPDARVIYGDGDKVGETGNYMEPYPTEDWRHRRLSDKCFLCQPSVIFHREVFNVVGPINESLQLVVDLEFWMRAGKHFTFHRLPLNIACLRHYPETKSQANQLRMQMEALLVGFRHYGLWSNRRLWSVAENLLLEDRPDIGVAMDPHRATALNVTLFWVMKTMRYLGLRVRPHLEKRLETKIQNLPLRDN